MADLEWHRAIQRGGPTSPSTPGTAPAPALTTSWHDYVAEAREAGCFDRIRTAPQGTFDGLFDLVHRVEALLPAARVRWRGIPGELYAGPSARAWAARGSLPEPVTPSLAGRRSGGCRRAIPNQLQAADPHLRDRPARQGAPDRRPGHRLEALGTMVRDVSDIVRRLAREPSLVIAPYPWPDLDGLASSLLLADALTALGRVTRGAVPGRDAPGRRRMGDRQVRG